jgi:hypothetical protein
MSYSQTTYNVLATLGCDDQEAAYLQHMPMPLYPGLAESEKAAPASACTLYHSPTRALTSVAENAVALELDTVRVQHAADRGRLDEIGCGQAAVWARAASARYAGGSAVRTEARAVREGVEAVARHADAADPGRRARAGLVERRSQVGVLAASGCAVVSVAMRWAERAHSRGRSSGRPRPRRRWGTPRAP